MRSARRDGAPAPGSTGLDWQIRAPKTPAMRKAEAAKLSRADLAEASRLGEILGLGTDPKVTRVRIPQAPNWYLAAIITVGSGAAVACLLAITLAATSNPVAAVVFGVMAVGGAVAAGLLGRRARSLAAVRRFFRYPGGFIQVSPDEPEPRVLRWAQVDSVTLVFNDADNYVRGLSWCTLHNSAGTAIEVGGRYSRGVVRDIASEAERILGPKIVQSLISAYESGEPVIMGNWRIDQTGVTDRRHNPRSPHVPWSDVREITVASENYHGKVDPASLITITAAAVEPRFQPRLSLSGIRNGIFLPHLLEHVAQRHNVLLRKTVVLKGKGG
jgi:hypothetical protein